MPVTPFIGQTQQGEWRIGEVAESPLGRLKIEGVRGSRINVFNCGNVVEFRFDV